MPEPAALRPLADLRIIALEQYGAGPFGSLHLADLGADVIKIEDPATGGDVGRYVPPYQEGEHSLFFETFNRGKRSVSLDITSRGGRRVLEDLVRVSDVVYSNVRGDVPERLRIRYADLADVNPRIVCCSLSAYGADGPRASEPGYDYVLQGLAGWMSLTGEPNGPPVKSGLSLVDYAGGLVAAVSMLAAVHAARRDGRGTDCDVSLFDTAIAMLTYPGTWHLSRAFEPVRMPSSAHPSLVPFQNFRTEDGWIVVACPKEKFWRRLVAAIGHPELGEDERFASFDARHRNRDELLGVLDAAFRRRTSAAWLEVLGAAGIPSGPVNDVEAALRDRQVAARGLVVETDHPVLGVVRQPATAVRVGERTTEHRRAPFRGEHGEAVLRELLDYDDRAIDEAGRAGAFGGSDDPAPA